MHRLIAAMPCLVLTLALGSFATRAEPQPVPDVPRFVTDYRETSPGKGEISIRCTTGEAVTHKIGATPSVRWYDEGADEMAERGILAVQFVEAQRVAWRLRRGLYFPVRGCAMGTPLVVVEEDAFITENAPDEPDIMRFWREVMPVSDETGFHLHIESRSEKIFLDPEGGAPFAHLMRLWPDDRFTPDFETLTLAGEKPVLHEPAARSHLYRSGTASARGWFRVDTAQSRSQEPGP